MLVRSFPAGPWQTNCYVVATGPGAPCVIIDPGMAAVAGVRDVVDDLHLHPVAVLVTHGHMDHMWSVLPVATGYGIPAVIHRSDRHLLTDPGAAVSPETAAALPAMLGPGERFAEPDEVILAEPDLRLDLAGLAVTIRHAPGHTAGSVMFDVDGDAVFTGDVLFAGAIGRTDLPGGSPTDMERTLREQVLTLADHYRVLPGHGPETTIATERRSNPYLLGVAAGAL